MIGQTKINQNTDKNENNITINTCYVTNIQKLSLEGIIESKNVKLVFDTGAPITVVRQSIINTDNILPTRQILHTANGSPLTTLGEILLKINIGNHTFIQKCIVVDYLCTPVLLGLDFITQYKVIINFDNKTLSMKDKKIRLTYKFDTNIQMYSKTGYINKVNKVNKKINISKEQEMLLLITKLQKDVQVTGDGDCGLHTLETILKNAGIKTTFNELLTLLNIPEPHSGYQLVDEDLAAVCDQYNLNLLIIIESINENKNPNYLYYKKNERPTVAIYHENNNHWRPGNFKKKPTQPKIDQQNIILITEIPNTLTRKNDISKHFQQNKNNLKINNEITLMENKNKTNIIPLINKHNNYITEKSSKINNLINPDSNTITSTSLSTMSQMADSHTHTANLYQMPITQIAEPAVLGTSECNKQYLNKIQIKNINVDINPMLEFEEKLMLQNLINKYEDCFAKNPTDIGTIDIGDIPIPTINEEPISLPPYRLSIKEQTEIQRQINILIEAKIIVPSNSSYASPAFLVPKTDGTKRLVVDYRALNKRVPHQNFPMPHIQTIYDCLEGANYFNIMDMQNGFLNVVLGKTDRHKLAFITHAGVYEWTRFPFGYKNSPRQFSQAVAKTLSGLLYLGTLNYVDDIINYAKTFTELLQVLEKLFIRLKTAGFKLKPSKCKFGYTQLKILGQIVSGEGVQPDPKSLDPIKKFPIPKTIRNVRSFLGMCNFFRKFINKYSEIAAPITDLTKGQFKSKNSLVKWGINQQNAFELLKEKLTSPPILKHFNQELEIIIWTDASKIGVAGTLLQKDSSDNKLHPISYTSRKLTESEANSSAIELELLAVVHSVQQFRTYIYGVHFEIWTDHMPLIYDINNIKSLSVKIQKLRNKLIDYDYKIIYRKGLLNEVCDAMSRNPINDLPIPTEQNENTDIGELCVINTINIQILQREDDYLNNIIKAIENPSISKPIWIKKSKPYFLDENGILHFNYIINNKTFKLITLPKSLRQETLYNYHDHPLSAHLGVEKTYKKILQRYYWPSIYKDTRKYVTSCLSCQLRKVDHTPAYGQMLTSPQVTGTPFERFVIDYIGPISPTSNGHAYILVGTCSTTKYAIAKSCKNADGKTTVTFLLEVIAKYGAIGEIHSDRGLHFQNKNVKDLLNILNIKNTFSIAYRPQSQGQTEKFNCTLIDMLSHFVQEKPQNWTQYLSYTLFAYNSAKNVTGYSSFYLLHGFEPNQIFEFNIVPTNTTPDIIHELEKLQTVRNQLPNILKTKFEISKKYHDKNKTIVNFEIGEKVLLRIPVKNSKFQYRFYGPCEIVKKISENTYLVQVTKNGKLTVDYKHVSQIKKFHQRTPNTNNEEINNNEALTTE